MKPRVYVKTVSSATILCTPEELVAEEDAEDEG